MNNLISASLLASDFNNLSKEIKRVESAGTDWLHYDVMDGVFVRNISFGEPVLSSIAKTVSAALDVHLMITDPIRYVENYASLGASMITVHYESTEEIEKVLQKIHSLGCKAGLAIKPATPVEKIKPFISMVDMVLVMTVEPGFGGQVFLADTLPKITEVKEYAKSLGKDILIQVDGGINGETAPLVREAGANVLVSGSFLFKAQDMSAAVKTLRG